MSIEASFSGWQTTTDVYVTKHDDNSIKPETDSQQIYKVDVGNQLFFIELRQGSKKLLGLIDTGANVNCIGDELIGVIKGGWDKRKKIKIRGIGGEAQSCGCVCVEFMLATGHVTRQKFIIIPNLKKGIIVGIPFLICIGGVINVRDSVMDSCFGQIQLLRGYELGESNQGYVGKYSFAVVELGKPDRPKNKNENENREMEIFTEKIKEIEGSDEQRRDVLNLLLTYKNLWKVDRPYLTTWTNHEIVLTTDKPLATRPRRFTEEKQQIIEDEIQKMEAAGIVEGSSSSYASEIVLVRKSTGEWRLCIDFRLINQFTVDDKFPLPPIQDLLHCIKGSKYFVMLDLRSGYWQIPMSHEARKYTAFRTPRGLKQFKVMPFGLKNAPATFQRMMEEILGNLHWQGVLVYLDDVLIHGQTFDEVYDRLKEVLNRFYVANLSLNLSKCKFFVKQISYLGFIVSEGVLKPNPVKVEALRRVRKPTNRTELRSLLGLLGFYRQFIPHFSSSAEPLTRLLRNTNKFEWSREHQEAMLILLNGLETQVLANPGKYEKLKLETDASDIAIGAILSSSVDNIHWRPVEFMSKTLNDTQRRWPVHEREAYAIVKALEKFDCYLRGRSFDVFTDCSCLQWMAKSTIGKISRWAARMAEYGMRILHKSGKEMQHVDFLSRFVNPPEEGLCDRMTVWYTNLINEIPTIEDVVACQKLEVPKWGKGFAMNKGIIFYRSKYYVPPTLRVKVIAAGHQVNPIVHNGMRKTKSRVAKVFRWPCMDSDITKYVQGCLSCQRARPGIETLQGLIRHHEPAGAFEKIYIDIWSTGYAGKQYHCLTMIDSLTRWAEVVVIPSQTGVDVSTALFKAWIVRFGVPMEIVCDRGPAFISETFMRLCTLLGCKTIRTTPRHPQGNLIETFHRNLRRGMCLFGQKEENGVPFDEVLALILMGYRATIHEALEDSPAFLTYGIDLRPALENDWRFVNRTTEKERIRSLNLTRFELVVKCQERAQHIEKAGLVNRETININDLVLIRLSPEEKLLNPIFEGSKKLLPKWSLPHRVIQVTPDGQSAVLRNLLTGIRRKLPLRRAHIRDLRFISPPNDDIQHREWELIIQTEKFSDILDPEIKQGFLEQFWEKMSETTSNKRIKRVTAEGEIEE